MKKKEADKLVRVFLKEHGYTHEHSDSNFDYYTKQPHLPSVEVGRQSSLRATAAVSKERNE